MWIAFAGAHRTCTRSPATPALDLIVLVPIEHPDRIPMPASEDRELRRAVDEMLATMIGDDTYEFGVEVLEVHGDVEQIW